MITLRCSRRLHSSLATLIAGAATLVGGKAHESTLPHLPLAQISAPAAGNPATLIPVAIDVKDAATKTALGALVRVTRTGDGKPFELAAHLRRPMGWFSLIAGTRVPLPAGEWQIEACHGLATEIAVGRVTVREGEAPELTLFVRHFHDVAQRRLVGANTHLHLNLNSPRGMGGTWLRSREEAEQYLTALGRSDALDLVYVSHLERAGETQNYVSNVFTRDDFVRLSSPEATFINGEEHRHEGGRSTRRGGPDELRYGHVLFLDLPELVPPASYGGIFTPGRPPNDGTPMQQAIRRARALRAAIIWCHGRQGTEDVPNWIAGLLDAQNIFDGGSEGTFESIFYPYLNAGFRIPFSTGTDWGCYDFSRVYVPLEPTATSRGFLDALAQGRSFITNGPLLEFEVEGRSAGDTLALDAPRPVKIRGRVVGRDDFVRAEIVHNGVVIARADARPVEGHFAAAFDQAVAVNSPGWLALRVVSERPYNDRTEYTGRGANIFGKALFAHTSAVYVTLGGRAICRPAAVRSLIEDVRASIATIEAKGAFASDAERSALLKLYRDTLAALETRLASARD